LFFHATFGRTPPLKHVIEALSMAIKIKNCRLIGKGITEKTVIGL
jgi:hypothetical protein